MSWQKIIPITGTDVRSTGSCGNETRGRTRMKPSCQLWRAFCRRFRMPKTGTDSCGGVLRIFRGTHWSEGGRWPNSYFRNARAITKRPTFSSIMESKTSRPPIRRKRRNSSGLRKTVIIRLRRTWPGISPKTVSLNH